MARAVCAVLLCPAVLAWALTGDDTPSMLQTQEGVSPVEKVITMLEDLQTQVIIEGKMEAKTYDKFACFCKELSDQKSADITDGQDASDEMTSRINSLSSDRADITQTIAELVSRISTLTNEMEAATANRKKEHLAFLKLEAELDLGVKELDGAANSIKAGTGGASLLEEFSVQTADLIERRSPRLSALLADGEKTGSSADIVETIEDIERDFEKELEDTRSAEDRAVNDYESLMADHKDQKKTAEDDLVDNKQRNGEKTEAITTNQQDLTAVSATLTDDKAYLSELTARCNAKSAEWDQRSQMRTDEITAITTAIHIMSGRVKESTSEKTVRFVQMPRHSAGLVQDATAADSSEKAESSDEQEIDEIMDEEPVFLQIDLGKPRSKLAELATKSKEMAAEAAKIKLTKFLGTADPEDRRERVIALLRQKGEDLQLPALEMLATQVTADPFVKIRKLIQELIERLLTEAADEANHKGWCDKELGKANAQRDRKAEAVKGLNEHMASNEAKRDKLVEEIARLGTEIAELTTVLAKTNKERNDESAENAATISEAEEGKAAVDEAIDVLSKFYKTAAKAEFVQVGSQTWRKGIDEDMPDAGFEGPNKGSQGAATGILGMMEVIQSDFVRTIEQTEKDEKNQAKEFFDFETATKSSMGTKMVGREHRENEHAETVQTLAEQKNNMIDEQSLLDKSLQELTELQPACIDTGMSYEERVAKREQEIESLKQALCVLDNEGPVQTEPGCEDSA